MYKMCHVCGAELKETPSGLDGREPVGTCKFCREKYRQESLRRDGFTPYATPLISPTISLKSTDSFVSSCSEFLVDENLQGREDANEGAPDTDQEYLNSSSLSPKKGIDESGVIEVEYLEDSNNDENTFSLDNSTLKDVQIVGDGDGLEGAEDGVDDNSQPITSSKEGSNLSHSFDIEIDAHIWVPPGPEDLEDDMEGSVANNDDDDDEFNDGMKWGQPSSLSTFGGERSCSFRFKEERQKAMTEVMSREFKSLVSRLLTSEGIPWETGENWVDIVTSLSWEAALLVKPNAIEGKAMDPEGYVKVKCIATGSSSQSRLIKGLVFKKNAAHKHMPTKYKNPKLLLLQGMLGQSSSGLSSFDSMEQEKDDLKSVIETIEMCHPNVVLVERTVSRDVQESLLAKGITLVFDMKLNRLERIARCTGSQIVSPADSLIIQKLKQCDSFHFEKFVEENGISREGGKKPSKTLMFLEGCPRPLGCTILLKGTHSDELKKIKSVVQCAVIVAYHLILETSFLVDQRAMFSTIHSVVVDGFPKYQQLPIVGSSTVLNSNASSLKEPLAGIASSPPIDIPISDVLREKSAYDGTSCNSGLDLEGISTLSGFSRPVINSYENDIGESTLAHHSISENSIGHQIETSREPFAPTILRGQILSSLSASLKKVLGDSFPLVSSDSHQSFSPYLDFKEREPDNQNTAVFPVSTSPESLTYCKMEAKDGTDDIKSPDCEQDKSLSDFCEVPLDLCKDDIANEDQMQCKDDISTVLDAESILFLMSSQSVLRGTVCEQSHLSRIKYYKNFDVSLRRFLRDGLLDQRHRCSACGEAPEAHVYYYTHQDGRLTVRVKQLPVELRLPGEADGKLWTWTLCSKCEPTNRNQRPTRRVVLSTAACALSFGKFLELSFSIHSTSNMLSSCGHSLHKDYPRFYGLGSMVAMFKYSSVDIYAACMPPPVLEFNNPVGQDWIKIEAGKVLQKGILMFTEVSNFLSKMGLGVCSSLPNPPMNLTCSVKKISEVDDMLKQEKSDFVSHVLKAIDKNERLGQVVHELLSLNRLIQELVLESYVWDRRLHLLLSPNSRIVNSGTTDTMHEEQVQFLLQKDAIAAGRIKRKNNNSLRYGDKISHGTAANLIAPINDKSSLSSNDYCNAVIHSGNLEAELEIKLDETSIVASENSVTEFQVSEPQYEGLVLGSGYPNNSVNTSINVEANDRLTMGSLNLDGSSVDEWAAPTTDGLLNDSVLGQDPSTGLSHLSAIPLRGENCQEECLPISEPLQVNQTTTITKELLRHTDSVANLDLHGSTLGEVSSKFRFKGLDQGMSVCQKSLVSKLDDSEFWVWTPFSETRKAYRKDLQRGYSQKFEFINSYTPEWLSSVHQLISEEGSRLHIPLGPDDGVVSVFEGEPTSIIACALALLQDRHSSTEGLVEKDMRKEKGEDNNGYQNAHCLASDASVASPYWSSNGSLDSEGMHAGETVSSEESYTSSFDGFNLVDSVPSLDALHPEIHLGVGKLPGKGKYSVVCIYAKQFHALRKRCCPCELDYIASLSRCKNWDAKGGKSGSFFVKTLDERFIIKQIKKTEFDSFLKFAQDYFVYINQSLSSGSQTCLAKILGIYQVTIRHSKSGKDLKYDLMVMENLTFGRNITRLYDLKGAQHARYTSEANGVGKVLLDQNFVEDMSTSPLYVSRKTKHLLQRAVWNDTSFLTSINVMDYSLLVGVDMRRRELVCGIIDYLRQYTWDKHLETWVKASLVVPKNVSPTVVSPKEYKKRFRKFMSMYFLTVPDHSCPERSSGPCKFCGNRSGDSFQLTNTEQRETK